MRLTGTIAGLMLAASAAAGCATTAAPAVKPRAARPAPPRTGVLSTGILVLGEVPCDGRTLPLVSPDGEFIATQTGAPPDWDVLLAAPGAGALGESRIEIHRLDRRSGETAFFRATDAMLLLGRACDGGGLLVESPHPDGSRWIGYTPWYSGPVQWLAADEHTNAFAHLGAGGRLAWCRRPAGAEHFDLVVRRDGEEWTIGAQGGDWLLPVWAAGGDGLFALRLEAGSLEAAYMIASGPESTGATMLRVPLAADRTVLDAYQCMAPAAAPGIPEPAILFFHCGADRMALWGPAPSPAAVTLLEPGSVAAALDPEGFLIVATRERLLIQTPASPGDTRALLPGAHVPKPVARTDWPYVVLTPAGDRMGAMAMRILRD